MKITSSLTLSAAVALALGLTPLALSQTMAGSTAAPPAMTSQGARSPANGRHKAATPTMPAVTASKAEIRQAQQALEKLGYNVAVDGMMGSRTRTALKKFQKTNGIPQSGRLDRDTRRGLGLIGGQPPAGLNLGGSNTATIPAVTPATPRMSPPRPISGMPQQQPMQPPNLSSQSMPHTQTMHRNTRVATRGDRAMPNLPQIKLVPVVLGTYRIVMSGQSTDTLAAHRTTKTTAAPEQNQ